MEKLLTQGALIPQLNTQIILQLLVLFKIFFNFVLIGVQLIYNVVFVSGV